MADSVQLDGQAFYQKIEKIVETWNQIGDPKSALLLVMGKIGEATMRPLTSDFFVWLLNYDFPEAMLLITKTKIVFAVSPKKKTLLEAMEVPMDYKGPTMEIVVRDTRQDNTDEVIEQVLGHVEGSPAKIGVFLKDQEDGDLTKRVFAAVHAKNFQQEELKELMERVHYTKIAPEILNQQTAANFVKWTFDNVVGEIEEAIEDEKTVKHESIQKRAEATLDDDKKLASFFKANPTAKADFLDYPLGVLVQSGDKFTLNKFNVSSDSNKLNHETIYINICGKYKDMNVMASRTLLVNPKDDQKKAYQLAYDSVDFLSRQLTPGTPIKDAYIATKNFIKERDANLASKVHTNFGFGIGSGIKEDTLIINETNENKVMPSMSFHVRITFSDVNPKPSRSVIGLGETILIDAEGKPVFVTGKIQRKYTEISYSLDDEEEEKQNGTKTSKQEEAPRESRRALITDTRLRQKNVTSHNDNEVRKKSQEELLEKKYEELKLRFENGEISNTDKRNKVKKMDNIQSYENQRQVPKDLKPGQVYVDAAHNTVLIPMMNQNSFAPFHVSTIRGVSTTQEGQWSYLRINLQTPAGGSTLSVPNINQPGALFVKELTLKCLARDNHLVNVSNQIKELIKKVKDMDLEEPNKQEQAQEDLSLAKGKKEILENLVIKPNIVGKKTVGALEIHQNGVRFASTKGHHVDIPFSNVKHAFFQPCADDELVVIIHFHLKSQIQIGTKKFSDVQFFKEAGVAADDLDNKISRKRLNDMDELEQEERERQQKIKLNNRFNAFVKLIEQASERTKHKLEFDIPFEDLDFYGCPHKSVVKVRPTKNCLIAISEFPFFVVDIADIEVVHFERLTFGIKNFDLAIIFKDFITFKRINSIPIEHVEDIKSYLDEIGIIYSESVVPMNWNNILAQIREDFEVFLDEGAWKFLRDDDEHGDEEMEEDEGDAEFSVDSEEEVSESSDDEDDFSDDDDNSSSQFSEDEVSEEGLSWDEMDKMAEEEDRRAAVRRTNRDLPPSKGAPPNKSRPGRR